ncbi:MAG: peptidase T [Planctomycetes bacterium]|nr:peptidase T [Planctomycetota bacterium]MBU4398880.1 peptidase T [Planctomycetota bacterium]MCG2682574.1 peptidase T [Planctomycetales bacterium]
MNKAQLLQRFLRYVQIDTTARPETDDYPSSPGQLELGRLVVEELQAMGIKDARQNQHGIIMGTIPATNRKKGTDPICAKHPPGRSGKWGPSPFSDAPTIAWCAHLDTSPETTGAGVNPQVIDSYAGDDIVLPGDPSKVIRTADNPELDALRGRTLITSDGTTLLGADDKAGVAVILEAAAWLMEHPEIPHGPVRICLTCDEEIARGVIKLDQKEIGAVACYTLDGHASGEIDVETFSADQAVVTVRGVNIHPSIAKGRMTNAIRAAADFIARLPRSNLSPETTEGREGFMHPYKIGGGVGEVQMKILLRDFDAAKLDWQADQLRQIASATMQDFPAANIEVAIERQYRNMAEGLDREPRAVIYAEEALRRLDRTAKRTIVRGGTDGSRLTEMGLPTPNLSCGGHNPHSALEWACLDEMAESVEWLVALAEVWGEGK